MIFGKGRADGRIGRQFDDPAVIVAQFQLARGAHHAVGFDTADRALLQLEAAGRNDRTRHAEYADQAGAGIGRAADDLQRIAFAGIDGQHLQLVGIGMALCGQHLGDAETGQAVSGIFNPFDFQADGVQLGGNLLDRSFGFEVVLEPGQRELHARAPTPAERVGTSSGEKP